MKRTLTLMFSLLCASMMISENLVEITRPISLNANDYDATGMNGDNLGQFLELTNDGQTGSLNLYVMNGAQVPWQGTSITVENVDLDKYPDLRVVVSSDSQTEWQVKLFAQGMEDQRPFSLTHDKNYSTITDPSHPAFEWAPAPDGIPELGEYQSCIQETFATHINDGTMPSTFQIWLWVVGVDTSVNFDKLELVGVEDNLNSINDVSENPYFILKNDHGIAVSGLAGREVDIYTLSGLCIGHSEGDDSADFSLSSGVYLVKVGNKVTKIIIQ